jgi:hypothetical protein
MLIFLEECRGNSSKKQHFRFGILPKKIEHQLEDNQRKTVQTRNVRANPETFIGKKNDAFFFNWNFSLFFHLKNKNPPKRIKLFFSIENKKPTFGKGRQ